MKRVINVFICAVMLFTLTTSVFAVGDDEVAPCNIQEICTVCGAFCEGTLGTPYYDDNTARFEPCQHGLSGYDMVKDQFVPVTVICYNCGNVFHDTRYCGQMRACYGY